MTAALPDVAEVPTLGFEPIRSTFLLSIAFRFGEPTDKDSLLSRATLLNAFEPVTGYLFLWLGDGVELLLLLSNTRSSILL